MKKTIVCILIFIILAVINPSAVGIAAPAEITDTHSQPTIRIEHNRSSTHNYLSHPSNGFQDLSIISQNEIENGTIESASFENSQVSSGPGDSQPDVAVDHNGNLYAVWSAGNYSDVYFAYRPFGGTWTTPEKVATLNHGNPTFPAIGVDGSSNLYVLWMDTTSSDDCHYNVCDYDIWFSFRDSQGGWTSPVRVSDDPGISRQMYPEVAVDSDGNAHAIWKDERDGSCNVYSAFRPINGSWGTNIKVNDTGYCNMGTWGEGLGLSIAPDGYVWAAWDLGYNNGILLAKRSGISNWGSAEIINSSGEDPSLAIDNEGNAYLVWFEWTGTAWGVNAAYKPVNEPWRTKFRVDNSSNASQTSPVVSVGSASTAFVAWVDGRNGNSDIYGIQLENGQSSGTVARIDDDASNSTQSDPTIADNGAGVLSILWHDGRDGIWRIFSATEESGSGIGVDLSIDSVMPVQVLEGQDLAKGKATAVKVVIRKTGNEPLNNVSVRVSTGSFVTSVFFVAESTNLDYQHSLIDDNAAHNLNFSSSEETKTIYFFSNILAPDGNSFQVGAEVDYPDNINETDESNNSSNSPVLPVYDVHWSGTLFPNLRLHYFRTDWTGTSITAFDDYYDYSNDFLRNVFPVSEGQFTPGKSINYVADTALFRGSDAKLNLTELSLWIKTTLVRMKIADPTADRFIATVPQGWFSSTTTFGDALGITIHEKGYLKWPNMHELVIVENQKTTNPNGPSIVSHEIGHSYGLDTNCEEYNDCNSTRQDGIGNIASPGLWVNKRIPIEVTSTRNIYCFMGGYTDNEYWIDANDYSQLIDNHRVTAYSLQNAVITSRVILASGTFDITGTVTLDNWYILPEGELTTLVPGPYVIEYIDVNGKVLNQQYFDISYDSEEFSLTQSQFVFFIPYVDGVSEITVKKDNISLARKIVSSSAPSVVVKAPNGGEQLSGDTTILWSGDDEDGDPLFYSIFVSEDTGKTWEPIAFEIVANEYNWDVSNFSTAEHYLIKIVATDGLRTGQDLSDTTFTIAKSIYLPLLLR